MSARGRLAAVAVLVCVAFATFLTGCGGDSGGGSSSSTERTTKTTKAHKKHRASTAPAPLTGSYTGPVPILMYHVVTAPKPGAPFPELWVPWKTFAATMFALKKDGRHGVTLDAVWKAWHGGPGLPDKPVVISFDDGYLSQYAHARPTLRALGWPGVLNLEGKNIDPKVGLSRRQVRGLIAAGWEIDAHSMTHPDLPTVGDAQLKAELVGSRKIIQKLFKVPVNFFCYPAGKNDARVQAATKAAGYLGATTVDPGIASKKDNPYALPRVRVNGDDTPEAVVQRLRDLGA